MQVDFAGNFTTQTQNTIQSSYWVSKQFTLYIASVWESHGCHSYVIVSDYLQLDRYAIMTFIMQLIDHIENNIRCFRNMFFSDGAASKFKQSFTLCEVTQLENRLELKLFYNRPW